MSITYADSIRLDNSAVIAVHEPFVEVNRRLLALLTSFTEDDWARPTVHADRDVKDLTAHLLHGSIRRVTVLRDGYHRPAPAIATTEDLVAFIQADNRDFIRAMRRVSPEIVIESIDRYDPQLLDLLARLPPHDSDGWGVAWAGESVSHNWFDVAREYTEKWHHQQQLRDATGRAPLYEPALFEPVLETFARGLPFALRAVSASDGERIAVIITGAVSLAWTLRRGPEGWSLWAGRDPDATTSVVIPADVGWRVWTKSMERDHARSLIQVDGDRAVVDAIVSFVAIMA